MMTTRAALLVFVSAAAACNPVTKPVQTAEVVVAEPGSGAAPTASASASTSPSASSGGPALEARRAALRKTVEGLLRAMTRSAVMGFERELTDPTNSSVALHQPCKSAVPVPALVPRVEPTVAWQSADFSSGDQLTGWKCLKFTAAEKMSLPCQLTYMAGGGYKGPKRGGPDPGAEGFEAAVECDQDGNGKTSLFTLTATHDKVQDVMVVAPQPFVSAENE